MQRAAACRISAGAATGYRDLLEDEHADAAYRPAVPAWRAAVDRVDGSAVGPAIEQVQSIQRQRGVGVGYGKETSVLIAVDQLASLRALDDQGLGDVDLAGGQRDRIQTRVEADCVLANKGVRNIDYVTQTAVAGIVVVDYAKFGRRDRFQCANIDGRSDHTREAAAALVEGKSQWIGAVVDCGASNLHLVGLDASGHDKVAGRHRAPIVGQRQETGRGAEQILDAGTADFGYSVAEQAEAGGQVGRGIDVSVRSGIARDDGTEQFDRWCARPAQGEGTGPFCGAVAGDRRIPDQRVIAVADRERTAGPVRSRRRVPADRRLFHGDRVAVESAAGGVEP